jgi:hypothetical protein
MASSFDYSEFKTQYDLKQSILQLSRVLTTQTAADGRPIFTDAPGTPLHQLLADLQIRPRAAPPTFAFELTQNITVKQAEQQCREHRDDNGQPEPLPFPDFIQSKCGRAYFNSALDAEHPQWIELSRPEASDHQTELSELLFLDTENTIPDWNLSLPKLRTLAQDRIYTPEMMKKSLLKLINRFHPDQTTVVSDKSADEIASFLLQMDAKRDKSVYYRAKLYALVRTPLEDLVSTLTKAEALIDKIYPANVEANQTYRSAAYRMAIISFLPDELAIPILSQIKKSMLICQPLSDEQILDLAMSAEEYSGKRPVFNLQFGRTIENIPVATHVQLNNIEQHQVVSHTQGYGLPYQAVNRPYDVYPPFLPLAEDRRFPVPRNGLAQPTVAGAQQLGQPALPPALPPALQPAQAPLLGQLVLPPAQVPLLDQPAVPQAAVQPLDQPALIPGLATPGRPAQQQEGAQVQEWYNSPLPRASPGMERLRAQRQAQAAARAGLSEGVLSPISAVIQPTLTSPTASAVQPGPVASGPGLSKDAMPAQAAIDPSQIVGTVDYMMLPLNARISYGEGGQMIAIIDRRPHLVLNHPGSASPQASQSSSAYSSPATSQMGEALETAGRDIRELQKSASEEMSGARTGAVPKYRDTKGLPPATTRLQSKKKEDEPELNALSMNYNNSRNYSNRDSRSREQSRDRRQSANHPSRDRSREDRGRGRYPSRDRSREERYRGRSPSKDRSREERYRERYRSRDRSQGDRYRSSYPTQNYSSRTSNQRYPSRDRSRDRDSRSGFRSRDNSRSREQRVSYRNSDRSRERSHRESYTSYDRDSRSRRDSSRNERSGYRSGSRDRRSNYSTGLSNRSVPTNSGSYRQQSMSPSRTRTDSRGRAQHASSNGGYQQQGRSRSRSTGPGSGQGRQGRPPAAGRDSQFPGREARSRERSSDSRSLYPNMRRSFNCRSSYDPRREKTCSKCSQSGHHEFDCPNYAMYNPAKCRSCEKYNHFTEDCKEISKFPPKTSEINNTDSNYGKN